MIINHNYGSKDTHKNQIHLIGKFEEVTYEEK
jgi:hypothetical protein